MLDTDTKRRIDSARDILVGKVPDPKSQVEQITIALIYKFMADMDAESEEMGGKRTFFKGEWERYGWPKLMHSGLSGHEVLALYGEAISKMPENAGIPALFRDIFKNAYLPYRDPETLKSFLKIIDEFEYDHSERLGDAFEYLLSVLGSQGDAGQFRTPRHIIDFMVDIVDPKKDETILDPACGTAGFLISSYKHILKNNQDKKGNSTLTPDEKEQLVNNIKGYDISPDMVRLSLVNLYLHGFPDPHIEEYDTLTSDDKWNEFTVCCLANPPFMSPKGGIKPHKRFSINSKRSEVLFVDYISEHLTPNGRAAIVVPEGIIFQSQNAYKQLRQKLVDNYLIAVVSLPAGVFQPYSGVKTSILIIDKPLARLSDTIGFFKVENDGYSLGAQRREIGKNDLPQIQSELTAYYKALVDEQSVQDLQPTLGLIVEKEKIAENVEYNLSGERYRETILSAAAFPFSPIGEICIINPRKSEVSDLPDETEVGFVPMADINENQINFTHQQTKNLADIGASYTYFSDNDVLLAKVTPCFENGKAGIARNLPNGIGFGSSEFYVLRCSEKALPEWVYFCVTHPLFRKPAKENMTGTGGLQRVPRKFVEDYQIPLPPLGIQKEIVAEIEGYQKVIDGARSVLDNYRPHIPIHPDWPMVLLQDVFKLSSGRGLTQANMEEGPFPVYGGNGQNGSHSEYFQENPTIVIGRVGAYCGAVHITSPKAWITDNALYPVEFKMEVDLGYIAQVLVQLNLNQFAKVGGQPSISQTTVCERKIPLPPIETQHAIIAKIKAERSLVATNQELIQRMEKKIQAAIARVWGEEEPAA